MVITGLTRNQFAGNRTRVRIPPSPPRRNELRSFRFFYTQKISRPLHCSSFSAKSPAAPTLLACKRALGAPACYQLFAGSNLFQNFSQASFSLSIDTRLGLDAVRVRTLFFLSRQSARAESAAKVSTSKASARNSRAGLFSFCPGKVPTPEQSSLCSGLFFACG